MRLRLESLESCNNDVDKENELHRLSLRLRELEIGLGQLADPEFAIFLDIQSRTEDPIQFKRYVLGLGIECLSQQIEKCVSMLDFMQTQDKLEQSLTLQANGSDYSDYSDYYDYSDYSDSNADEGNNQSDNNGNFANTPNKKRKLRETIAPWDAQEKELERETIAVWDAREKEFWNWKHGERGNRKGTVHWCGIEDGVAQNPGGESSE